MEQRQEIAIWQNETSLEEIKKCFAAKLTDIEFAQFISMGKLTGLNPFLREVWAVKYKDSEPAQIFIGRDGYRKSAQMQPDYDYHICDAVHSNDKFGVKGGQPYHIYDIQNRGHLVGAYCLVKRKSTSMPQYVFVELKEYIKPFGVWKEKPSTMIKKVAEAQALRMAFQTIYAGTYSEYEQWKREDILRQVNTPAQTSLPASNTNPHASQTIDIDLELQDVMPKDEKDALIKRVDDAKTLDELRAIWKENENRILDLPYPEKTPILVHINARKKSITDEINKTAP